MQAARSRERVALNGAMFSVPEIPLFPTIRLWQRRGDEHARRTATWVQSVVIAGWTDERHRSPLTEMLSRELNAVDQVPQCQEHRGQGSPRGRRRPWASLFASKTADEQLAALRDDPETTTTCLTSISTGCY